MYESTSGISVSSSEYPSKIKTLKKWAEPGGDVTRRGTGATALQQGPGEQGIFEYEKSLLLLE